MSYVRGQIVGMAGYVPGEQPQAGKFIKLNTNENPYPCSPAVTLAIQQCLQQGLTRYPDPLATAFRQAASDQLGVPPDWILCGNGSDDLLTILTRTFVDPGRLLRMPYPSYILYRSLAEIQGARSQEVRFRPDWTLGADFVAPDPDLRLAFLPNPNSPTGTILRPEQVLELARQLPCPLVVDEAYVDFADQHCVPLVRECERVIVTRTLSKSYALAGLRFGFLVAQPHLIREMVKVKDSYNCDALSIAGATAAISDVDWLNENRSRIVSARRRLTQELRACGFTVPDSHANFVWCTRPDWELKPIYERLKNQRVLIRYMQYRDWGEGLRVTVGSDEQIDAFLALLRCELPASPSEIPS